MARPPHRDPAGSNDRSKARCSLSWSVSLPLHRVHFPYPSPSLAPLKTLGRKLRIPVTTIPQLRAQLKTWTVWRIPRSSIASVNSTQPPPPFHPLPADADGTPPPNRLLLTASFGRILPSSLLSLFRPTHTLNVHPSALPAYRGPAPIQRALLNGERDTAVCVIEMKRRGGIDAGDILGRVPIVRVHLHFLSCVSDSLPLVAWWRNR